MAVQISGNDITGPRDGTFSRNVSIAGTLTYEDVTNVDSIGLVTARNGIEVGASPGVAASISVDGNMIVSGIATIGTGLSLGDNINAMFGDGGDLRIYHNGSDSTIMNSTGNLTVATDEFRVRGDGYSEYQIKSVKDGAVELYHDNSKKLETASGGVTVTGTVAATSYTGDGSALTGIEAGIQTSNAASMSGITTVLDLSKDDFKITVSGITTVDVRGGSEGNSHTLRIHNSGITTVGFSTYFLFPSGSAPIIPTADGTISLISFTVDRQGAVGLATQLLAGSSVNFS